MKTHTDTEHLTPVSSQLPLVTTLAECIAACNHCMVSCLHEEEAHHLKECIELNHDCAAICQLTLNLLTAHSRFAAEVVKICVDVCARCAAECRQHPMEHCTECEAACIKCEQACRDYLKETNG